MSYMALVERGQPLAALRQYVQEAALGEGRLVLLAGEAGVGKSVLVEHVQREVADASWSWGICDGLSTPGQLATLRWARRLELAPLSLEGVAVLAAGTGFDPEELHRLTGGNPFYVTEVIASPVVERQVPSHRRAAIHAQILAVLRSAGGPFGADDARRAFHAEGAGDHAAVLHHAARAAELAAAREAAAQYQRALRAAAGTAGADLKTVARLYSGLAVEAALGDATQTAADADEHALALWRELADWRQEGETLRRYAMTLQHLCRGDEALAAAERAIEVLEPLGQTTELAAAYLTLAIVRMMRAEREPARTLALRAQAAARQVGAIDVLADALNTEGCALSPSGDPSWTEPVLRALELALAHDLAPQAGRAYGNLCGILNMHHRYREAERFFAEGIEYCDDHDLGTYSFHLRAGRTLAQLGQGRWDELLTLGRQLLDEDLAPMTQIDLRLD